MVSRRFSLVAGGRRCFLAMYSSLVEQGALLSFSIKDRRIRRGDHFNLGNSVISCSLAPLPRLLALRQIPSKMMKVSERAEDTVFMLSQRGNENAGSSTMRQSRQ